MNVPRLVSMVQAGLTAIERARELRALVGEADVRSEDSGDLREPSLAHHHDGSLPSWAAPIRLTPLRNIKAVLDALGMA